MACKKKRYKSENRALNNAIAMAQQYGSVAKFRAYPCPDCKGWHLTSDKPKTEKKNFKQIKIEADYWSKRLGIKENE